MADTIVNVFTPQPLKTESGLCIFHATVRSEQMNETLSRMDELECYDPTSNQPATGNDVTKCLDGSCSPNRDGSRCECLSGLQ